MALEITDATINSVLANNEFVVIDFWAAWCGPCRMMGPVVDAVAAEAQESVVVGKLDVANNPIAAQKYNITSIPCIVYIKNGEEIGRDKGVMAKAALSKRIADMVEAN